MVVCIEVLNIHVWSSKPYSYDKKKILKDNEWNALIIFVVSRDLNEKTKNMRAYLGAQSKQVSSGKSSPYKINQPGILWISSSGGLWKTTQTRVNQNN